MQSLYTNFIAIITFVLFSNQLYSQKAEINLIVSVDDQIPISGIDRDMLLLLEDKTGFVDTVQVQYSPGALLIDSLVYKDILALKYPKSRFLIIHRVMNRQYEVEIKSYSVSLPKDWVILNPIIFSIFNMDKKRNRKKYQSKKKYVYEIESNAFTSLPIY